MRIHKLQLGKRAMAGCFAALLLLWPLLPQISAQNQSGKISVTMRPPFFGGAYGACILIEHEEGGGPEQNANSESSARNYQLKHKIVAGRDNTATEINLPRGVYRVRVLSRGYEEFASEPFELSSGEIKAFEVTLRRSLMEQHLGITEPPLEDPRVTAQTKGTKRLVPFKTIVIKGSSGIRERQNIVVTNALDWENLWNKIYATSIPLPHVPLIDFKNRMVIASSYGERNTGGFGIEIIRAVETDDAIELWVKTSSPVGGAVTLAFTQPIHVIEMERVDKKIEFVRPRYQSPCL